jgi:hypothetical protein
MLIVDYFFNLPKGGTMKLYLYILFSCLVMQNQLQAAEASGTQKKRIDPTLNDALVTAINKKDTNAVEKLFAGDVIPDPDVNMGIANASALGSAIQNKMEGSVRVLLENGANPNLISTFRMTPISLAANQDSLKMVQLLMKYGANPFIKSGWLANKDKTAFDYATSGGDYGKGSPKVKAFLENYLTRLSPQHKKDLQKAAQKIISGMGPLQAQQTAGRKIQEFLSPSSKTFEQETKETASNIPGGPSI